MHSLAIAYSKIRKNLLQQRARLRAYVEYVFPEFFEVVEIDTRTARYLLKRYFLPEHYHALDVEVVGMQIAQRHFRYTRGVVHR